jgi:hypothetical protein
MANIDTDKLSPALQVLIGLELEYNEVKHELSQLRKELDDVKEKIQNGNDFSKYPVTLTVNDIAEILRIGKVQAYQLTHQESFPKIREGKRIIVPKAAFINWLNSEAFSGMQYVKERGIYGKK